MLWVIWRISFKRRLESIWEEKNKVNTKIKNLHPEYRLLVERSNLYVSAQVLDAQGNVVAVSSDKTASGATKTQRAEAAGASFAEVLKGKGVEKIAFDRNGYLYHGRIKAFADGLRKGGIQF